MSISIFLLVLFSYFSLADIGETIRSTSLRPEIKVNFDEPAIIAMFTLTRMTDGTSVPLSIDSYNSDNTSFTFKPDENLEELKYYSFTLIASDYLNNRGTPQEKIFQIDLGPTKIDLYEPKNEYQSSPGFDVVLKLNRPGKCKGSSVAQSYDTMGVTFEELENDDYILYKAPFSKFNSDQFYVMCNDSRNELTSLRTFGFVIDSSAPIITKVDDTSFLNGYPEYTNINDKLRVLVEAEDPESGIEIINCSVQTSSGTQVSAWTISDDVGEWQIIRNGINKSSPMILEDKATYYVVAKAMNKAGVWSQISRSDGIVVDLSLGPQIDETKTASNLCENNIQDEGEWYVDCGGSCPSCPDGNSCTNNSVCSSGYCNEENICSSPKCDDNVLNGDESDIDCGGSCSACEVDKTCNSYSDCLSLSCDTENNICIEATCNDLRKNGDESDVDCGGSCDIKCSIGKSCENNVDCDTGSCSSGKCDESSDIDGDGMLDSWEERYGLSTEINDAQLDPDGDGLTNIREQSERTNPKQADTDMDGYDDGVEVEKGFDPLDPNDHPGSPLFLILLIISGLVLMGGISYLVYLKRDLIMPYVNQFMQQSGLNQAVSQIKTQITPLLSQLGININTSQKPIVNTQIPKQPLAKPNVAVAQASKQPNGQSNISVAQAQQSPQNNLQKPGIAHQLMKNYRSKEIQRKRNSVFSSFDSASKDDSKETSDKKNEISDKDINGLFGNIKSHDDFKDLMNTKKSSTLSSSSSQ